MSDDPTRHAIQVVARHVVAYGRHDDDDPWALYPEIGEDDWQAVEQEIDRITEGLRPTEDAYAAAYEHLEHRAAVSHE